MRARLAAGAAIVMAGLSVGCGSAALHMRVARTRHTVGQPAEGRAQVVFFVPHRSREIAGIVDQRGTYYGQVRADTMLVREVPPGRYRFYAIRDRNGYAVDVPLLEAGQTAYIAGIDPVLTSFVWRSMSGCDAEAAEGRASLSGLSEIEPDPDVPLETVLAELGDIPRRTGEADRDFEAMSPAQRALRTVDAESLARGGRCGAEAGGAPSSGAETATAEGTPAEARASESGETP